MIAADSILGSCWDVSEMWILSEIGRQLLGNLEGGRRVGCALTLCLRMLRDVKRSLGIKQIRSHRSTSSSVLSRSHSRMHYLQVVSRLTGLPSDSSSRTLTWKTFHSRGVARQSSSAILRGGIPWVKSKANPARDERVLLESWISSEPRLAIFSIADSYSDLTDLYLERRKKGIECGKWVCTYAVIAISWLLDGRLPDYKFASAR